MLRAVFAISLLPVAAAAEVDFGEAQPGDAEVEQINKFFFQTDLKSELDISLHASAGAQAGRVTGAYANAGGEIAWDVGRCRALHVGGEANFEAELASGSAWGGGCFPSPINRMELTVRGDHELQPSLSSLPIGMRSRYAGFSVEIKNTFVGWSDHEIIPFAFSIGTWEQPGVDTGRGSFAISAYRRVRADGRELEILPIALRAAGAAEPAVGGGVYIAATGYEFSPFRVARTSVATLAGHDVEADFAAGLAYGTIADPPESRMGPSTTRFRDYDLYADTTIRASHRHHTYALHLRRAFEPTLTEELLLDTRAEASFTHTTKTRTLYASTFAAVTRRLDRGGPVESTPSGGVRGVFVQELPYKLQLQLAAEAARSFYPTLDAQVASDTAWSAQASATVAFKWSRGTP